MKSIWIANDRLTCIPGTKTFWHMLMEIPGAEDKTGTHNRFLAEKIENDPGSPDLIIRNASFCRRFNRPEKTISFFQDLPRDDRKDDVVYNSECVVFNSEYTARVYSNDLDKIKRAEIIPIGVNTEIFKPIDIRKDNNRPTAIFVGDKGHTKNTDLFEAIVRKRTDIDFIYVSKQGHKINLPNVANITGGVDEVRMSYLYNQSDFILLTSPVETLHLSSIEAGFCNVPVVGTRTGWLATDEFDDCACGTIVEEPTLEAFNKHIDWMISHIGDKQMVWPRDWLMNGPYAWENCKESWMKLMDEIL